MYKWRDIILKTCEKNKAIKIAKNVINIDINIISEVTGLSKEEIEN